MQHNAVADAPEPYACNRRYKPILSLSHGCDPSVFCPHLNTFLGRALFIFSRRLYAQPVEKVLTVRVRGVFFLAVPQVLLTRGLSSPTLPGCIWEGSVLCNRKEIPIHVLPRARVRL